jgi:hypothetical protein
MSLEKCELCQEDSTPWKYVKGHICEDCYQCIKKVNNCSISKKDLEKIYPSRNKTEAYVYPCQHQWISVKDRLPKIIQFNVSDSVLICYKTKNDENYLRASVGFFSNIDNIEEWTLASPLEIDYFPCDHSDKIFVTHWMPLPGAPEDE